MLVKYVVAYEIMSFCLSMNVTYHRNCNTVQDTIIFPSKLEVDGPANSVRSVTIPVSFMDVSSYKTIFAAALIGESLLTILLAYIGFKWHDSNSNCQLLRFITGRSFALST